MKEWFTNPLLWIAFLSLLSVAAGAINMKVRKVRNMLSMIGILCGIGALLSLLYFIPIKITISEDKLSIYEKLSFHMWILEMVLLTVGISVAVLGFIGYQAIKDEAVKKAAEEAREEARREFTRWEDDRRGLRLDPGKLQPEVQEEPLEEDVS